MTKHEKALLIVTIYLLNLYGSLAFYNALKHEATESDDIVRFVVFCLLIISGLLFVVSGDEGRVSDLNDYYCIFFKEHDPRTTKPVAVFDRHQFLGKFLSLYPGKFREEDEETEILTVAKWLRIYQRKGGE